MRNIDHIIVHCSATPATMDVDSVTIDRWHRERKWLGNGYHYVIKRNGQVESEATGQKCRPLDRPGAHVGDCGRGWNKRSIGICLVGGTDAEGKTERNFTPEQMESLKSLLEHLNDCFPNCLIMGHRDLIELTDAANKKDCPAFDVKEWLEEVGL
ncbi:N-acetylmuramoyl-L-alanine amidase [Endozoicomonas ascidiicola]|uniref:N-acetylmuramoyl-L-alanine amidase n=1 Tax=Endozoicomonas ascidiicola TaxID=1698521 RepID=UPI00082CFF52|nr:N-acetylmuramoyl-L-alanine amidase [Endozoicomonas ascidiicola]